MPLDIDIFGKGIYSPRQAARLVGGSAQEIRRWTRGSGPTEPLWHAYYQELDDTAELSFADLIEVRVVKAFKQAGISTQAIRFAIKFAQEQFGVERPLSNLEFKTDGSEILMEAVEKDGEFVSLAKGRPGQKVFAEIVKQSVKDLEYEDDTAARWRPHKTRDVVIDPRRQFGSPIIDDFGIATSTLFEEYQTFKDVRYLSKIYDIPIRLVNEAIRFEKLLDEMNG
ncbi:hypothetical protein [Yoonia sp. 2307UL14-13]|uniref:hypothetical protein n=1 Tax=Yoonia sp. 2307UL14-13 TaxID=3126506 RepID=UPI0030ACE023